jgi:hypothetical protein
LTGGRTLYPPYMRGEAYLAAKPGPAAAAEFQKILDHLGVVQDEILAELRHGMIKKSLNPFRISLGNRRVYTTFAIELKTLR